MNDQNPRLYSDVPTITIEKYGLLNLRRRTVTGVNRLYFKDQTIVFISDAQLEVEAETALQAAEAERLAAKAEAERLAAKAHDRIVFEAGQESGRKQGAHAALSISPELRTLARDVAKKAKATIARNKRIITTLELEITHSEADLGDATIILEGIRP